MTNLKKKEQAKFKEKYLAGNLKKEIVLNEMKK